jgi:hypothetical protein
VRETEVRVITFLSKFGSLNRIIVTEHIGATKKNYATCKTANQTGNTALSE